MGPRRWRIRIISGTERGGVFNLTGHRFRIGRTRGDVVLKGDFRASGAHAELFYHQTGDTWAIRDLHSSNGTRVNNEPVFVKNLTAGDRFKIGSTEFLIEEADATGEFTLPAGPEPATVPAPKAGLRLVSSDGNPKPPAAQEAEPGSEPGVQPLRPTASEKLDPLDDLVRVLSSPAAFFASLAGAAARPQRALLFIVTVAGITGALNTVLVYSGYVSLEDLPFASVSRELASAAMIPLALVAQFLSAGIGALVLLGLIRVLGGRGRMVESFQSAAFTLAPAVIGPVLMAIPSYGRYLVLIPFAYRFYLCALALARAHGAKPAPSYAVCSLVGCAAIAGQLYVAGLGAPAGRRIASPQPARAVPQLPRRSR